MRICTGLRVQAKTSKFGSSHPLKGLDKRMMKVNSKSDLSVAKRVARKTGSPVIYKAKGKRGTGRIVPFADGRVVVFSTNSNG